MSYKKGSGFRSTGRETQLINEISSDITERTLSGRPPGKKYPKGSKYRPKEGGVFEVMDDASVDPRGKITLRLKRISY